MVSVSGPSIRRSDHQKYLKLLPLEEVKKRIVSAFEGCNCGIEEVPVDGALSRIAAERTISNTEIPRVNIAAMDGYAVRYEDLEGATASKPIRFRVKGKILPSDLWKADSFEIGTKESFQVATGAPIPLVADVVVRVEDTRLRDDGSVQIMREFPRGKNISIAAEDVQKGELIVENRQILGPANIAVLIATGKRTIKVYAVPIVGVLSIGDELTEFSRNTEPSKYGTYNNYSNMVRGYLEQLGLRTRTLGVCRDDPIEISAIVAAALKDVSMVCTIGGSSVGATDFAIESMDSLRSSVIFHGVRAVPIRPAGLIAMNMGGSKKPVVVIPGHAVSAALTVTLIVLPIANLLSGLGYESKRVSVGATATEEFRNDRAIDALVLAQVKKTHTGSYSAIPRGWGSNLLSNLSKSNGFVRLKPHEAIHSGGNVLVEIFSPSELFRLD